MEAATSGLATQQALNAHVEDDVIHVTAAEKIIWDNKLDPSALDGYATETYVDGATSALASKTYVDDGLALKEDLIGPNHKIAFDNVSGHPAIPTKTSDLTNDSDFQTAAEVTAAIASATSGKLDAPAGGSEGQVLTKTAGGAEWADAQGGGIEPYDLPVSAPSAGEKWFSATSEDWTREFPAE